MDRIYSSEQIVVPATLPAILKAYSKEVIRFQPEDVVAFSRDYFNALANGEEQQFLGQLERAKGNSATAKVTAKAEAAKADPVYNGVDDVQDTYTAAEEETKQADYAASANDAALVEFITSESFIEFSNAVFDISQQDQDDEKMSATELSTAVAVLSDKLQSETPPTEQEVVAFLEMFDTDQDGSLDRDEFLRFAQQLFLYVMSYQFVQKAPEVSEVIQVIFNSCDTEGQGPDGLLVFSEVWDAVDLVNQQLPKALRVRSDADTVQAYIDAFSTGDKEGLNLQEFNEMITTILGLTE